MRKHIAFGSVMASLLALASIASAQTYSPALAAGAGYGGSYGGYGGYGGYGHSSTYEEGVFRGLADFTRAIGDADYMSSLAGINRQESWSRYLDNRKKVAETYFEMRQINRAAREAARSQPLSLTQYAALAKQQAPERLSEADYNRVVGRLAWPAVLSGEEFAAERNALDKAFAGRTARDVGVSTAFNREVRELTSEMQTKLRDRLQTMSPMEFIAAKKFLTSISFEAQQPLVSTGLASAD